MKSLAAIDYVGIIFFGFVFGFIGVGLFALTQDHSIKCYYTTARSAPAYAVKADIPWAEDPIVFKTNTIQELSMYLSSVKVCGMREPGNRA